MTRLSRLALAAALGLAGAAQPVSAQYYGDYANAWLGERLCQDRPASSWRQAYARPSRHHDGASSGPRSWNAYDENPWANTYGTPATGAWRATTTRPADGRVVRVCSCYLSADARSWDGGPLTSADITRLCTAQCF